MRQYRSLLFCILPLVGFHPSWADSPVSVQLRMEANPKTITIGDPIRVEITIVTSSSVTPALFKVPETLGEFEIKDSVSTEPKPSGDGKVAFTHSFLATTFSTGTQKIPALTLAFSAPDGSLAETKTEEIPIEVRSLLTEKGDEGNIRPLKGLYNFRSYLWVWIILGILLMAGLLYYLWTHYKRRSLDLGIPQGPPVPPAEWAWSAIQKLEDSDLIERGQIKEFYIQLSVILRDYLERRYAMSALERTSSELLSDFRRMNLSLEVMSLLRDFLETGDLVKFAKYTPGEEDIEKDLNRIKQIVSSTTPQEQNVPKNLKQEIPV